MQLITAADRKQRAQADALAARICRRSVEAAWSTYVLLELLGEFDPRWGHPVLVRVQVVGALVVLMLFDDPASGRSRRSVSAV